MLFNSSEFLLFLPVTLLLYWLLRGNLRWQNVLLLLASYVFYGWWDERFLSLIAFSTLVDYLAGLKIQSSQKKKLWLGLSIGVNLGLLGFFKYYNFFVDSWVDAWAGMGITMQPATMQIILPVGISFYTFQTMSYSLDIYKGKLEPTKDIIAFAAFVSFFPQLVAGPIERATNLLPQILNKRSINVGEVTAGIKQIIFGLFKKVVIADALAPLVNDIFNNYEQFSGATLAMGAVFFAFQIYGDFSGYSDIAIGTARLFGFQLMSNFKFPYFSRNVGEFWRRWHISLSTWFRDYVYIPLGGSKVGKGKAIRNIFIVFLVSGFWHGANYTYIVWGGIHALMFVPLYIWGVHKKFGEDTITLKHPIPFFKDLGRIVFTFTIVTLAWVFFRAESLTHAWNYLDRIISHWNGEMNNTEGWLFVILLLAMDWLNRKNDRDLPAHRVWFYFMLVLVILRWEHKGAAEFIYFQF